MSANILEALYAAYHGDKETRTAATDQLTALMNSPEAPHYLVQLIDAGVNPSIPVEQSLSALLYAKNSLLYTMPDQLLEAHPDALETVEQKLFQGMFVVPESHRKVIKECVATLISGFSWDYLDEIIPMVCRIAQPENNTQPPLEYARALLQLLYTYLKRFKTPPLVSSAVKMRVIQALIDIMPLYISVYQDFFVTRLTFKVMECLIEAALRLDSPSERKHLKNGAMFDGWWTVMIQFLQAHFSPPSGSIACAPAPDVSRIPRNAAGAVDHQFVLCVKRIAMITYSIMNDATRRKKPVPCALHFINSAGAKKGSDPAAVASSVGYQFMLLWEGWLQCCIHTTIEGSSVDDRSIYMKSELYAIRYIKLCTLEQSLYTHHLLSQAIPMIEKLFLPYLRYSEDDDEVFTSEEDLPEYTQYMLDESVGMGELSQRQAASNAILAFIGGKKAFHAGAQLLHPLVQALGAELNLENTPANMPRLFGALHLLSTLRKYLRKDEAIWNHQMHVVLAQSVAPRIAQGSHIAVRSKAITVCQRYAKVPMPSEEVFASFVAMMCQCLHDTDARIRLSGIDAVCTLLEMKRARNYLAPYLVPVVEQCMEFLNKVQTTFIPTVILHVATHFAPEIAPVMDRLGSALVQQFLASAFDLEAMEGLMGADDGDAALQQYDAVAFSAEAILRALDTVLTSCENNLPAVEKMRPDLVRLIRLVLPHPNSYEYLEQTLVIFLHLVHYCSPNITPDLWETLPLVFQTVESGSGIDVFNTIEELLDNFISGAPAAYCQNAQLMDLTLQCCEKMLVAGVVTSTECKMAAPQLIEALVHETKVPQCPPDLLTPYIPRMLHLLLQSLLQSSVETEDDVHLRIWVLVAVMDLLYYDPHLSLKVLIESNAAVPFFQGFFQFFRGCIPHLLPSEAQAAGAEGGAAKPKKGKKNRKAAFDEAEAVVNTLSLLTRKVLVLGLSSLLSFIGATAAAPPSDGAALMGFVQVFLSDFATLANGLVEYCIATNANLYGKRCVIARESLDRIARGEVEDDVEDVDPDDEAILGVDGGDDTGDMADGDDADEANDLGSEDLELDDDDDEWEGGEGVGALFGFEPDEGDDYESPIDEINEVEFFVQSWLQKAAPTQLGGIVKSVAEYQQFATTTGEYRQLCLALEASTKKDYMERRETFAQVTGTS